MIEISDIEKELASEVTGTDKKSRAVTTRLSDIQSEPISWLWPGRIALGKLTLIVGDPGLGKSLVTTTLAAIISKGYEWPIDEVAAPIGDVILLSAEDDAADTTKPRLEAIGADCTRIHILRAIQEVDGEGAQVQRMFSLKKDMARLEELLISLPECRLLIIDPISAYLDGGDSHNNTDVRGMLAPIAQLAARYKIAIVVVSHLNKSNGGSAVHRTNGSVAFVAAARAAFLVTKDKDNPNRRLILPIKNNLAKDTSGLAYSISAADNEAPVLLWENEPVNISADEALATPTEPPKEPTGTDEAMDFLRYLLSNGALAASDVKRQASEAGITPKCLQRARERLRIKPTKTGFEGGWVWALPNTEDDLENSVKGEGILGVEGNLGQATPEELRAQVDWFDSL